jgi:YVTN family beta-propeller protein
MRAIINTVSTASFNNENRGAFRAHLFNIIVMQPAIDGRTISQMCVLDAKSCELFNTIKAGARPWGIAFSPDGKYLSAANGPSVDVSVAGLATEKEIARVKAGSSPWGIIVVPNTK